MKIITAIGIPEINEQINIQDKYEVIGRDIQYQEGILEILEERDDIEGIILSNNIIDEMNFNLLISKIIDINKDIEIIVFLKEKDDEIEMFLNSKKIYKIYYLDNYEIFFKSLNTSEMTNKDISKNIEDFKKIIYEQKNITNENSFYNNELKNNIISVSGSYGVGKSIISILLAKYLSKNYKVLLIDCDFYNKSINTILGISKLPKNYDKKEILKTVIKYKTNLYILSSFELFINNLEKENYSLFIRYLEKLKNEFDYIVIDTSSNILNSNIIFSYSSKILFLVEPNLSEVKKANIYLEQLIRDYDIEESKINILFNKVNKYKINDRVLNEIYAENNIIGEIKYNEKYNLIINKNIFKDEEMYEDVFKNIKRRLLYGEY